MDEEPTEFVGVQAPQDESRWEREKRIRLFRANYGAATAGKHDFQVEADLFGLRFVSDEALRWELQRRGCKAFTY